MKQSEVSAKKLARAKEVLDREAYRIAQGIADHVTRKVLQGLVDAGPLGLEHKKPTKRPPKVTRRKRFTKAQTTGRRRRA